MPNLLANIADSIPLFDQASADAESCLVAGTAAEGIAEDDRRNLRLRRRCRDALAGLDRNRTTGVAAQE